MSRQLEHSIEFYKWSIIFYYLAVVDLEIESSKSPTILKRSSKFGYTISSSMYLLLVLSTTNYFKIKKFTDCYGMSVFNFKKTAKTTQKYW